MGKCTNDTVLGRRIMMTIPLQVLVSMCRFTVHFYTKGVVCLRFDQGINKKGIAPFSWLPSTVNFIAGLYCWYDPEKLLMGLSLNDPSVIHKPYQSLGGLEADLRASLSKCSMYWLATMGLTSDPIAAPSTCSWNLFWNEKYVLCRQNPRSSIIFCTDNTVLLHKVSSCSNRSFMMLRAGSVGTEVNNAVTS